jgi:hypothetical protein
MTKYHENLTKKEIELFEKLADIEHSRWADWQKYYHSKCFINKNNENIIIPKDVWDRAERQIKTSYEDLSEAEKESDREQVMRYWNLIKIK